MAENDNTAVPQENTEGQKKIMFTTLRQAELNLKQPKNCGDFSRV